MSQFEQFDRSRIKLEGVHKRGHLLTYDMCLPLKAPAQIPNNNELTLLAERIKTAKTNKNPVILFMGGHLIKLGLSRFVIDLIQKGWVTHVATTGAGLIHDFELALIGGTSEDVGKWLDRGQFGLWEETSWINENFSYDYMMGFDTGLGECIEKGIAYNSRYFKYCDLSIAITANQNKIPYTCHISIGSDINHCMANCDGAALGKATLTDFLIFAKTVQNLDGGVFLNIGSAITGPEVFVKALSMARNVAIQDGWDVCNITTAVFDIVNLPDNFKDVIPEPDDPLLFYRPWKTLLVRSVTKGGTGYYIKGNYRETVPALWALLNEG